MKDIYDKHLRYTSLSRCEQLGRYIAESGDTVRGAAKIFGVSKSTVHKDLTKVLKQENLSLYKEVSKVLLKNKEERHIRGGLATKDKYDHLKLLKDGTK
ncbi:MAG: sporulation transcriptional regulator SpoIIID [Oscillospiraceae bacterium]